MGTKTANDMYEYNFGKPQCRVTPAANNTWKTVQYSNKPPIARYLPSAVVYKNALWVFGGDVPDKSTLNDLWKFDLSRRLENVTLGSYKGVD